MTQLELSKREEERNYARHMRTIWLRKYGNLLQRTIYHYWYHTGENMAIRQLLGHDRLGYFVGNIDDKAPYRPEA